MQRWTDVGLDELRCAHEGQRSSARGKQLYTILASMNLTLSELSDFALIDSFDKSRLSSMHGLVVFGFPKRLTS